MTARECPDGDSQKLQHQAPSTEQLLYNRLILPSYTVKRMAEGVACLPLWGSRSVCMWHGFGFGKHLLYFFFHIFIVHKKVHSSSNSNNFSDKTPPGHVATCPPSIFYSGGDSVATCHDGALHTRGMGHMTQVGALSRTGLSPYHTRSGGMIRNWAEHHLGTELKNF